MSERRDAKQFVIDGETACLPKGCPPPFTVVSAKFTKNNVVLAHVQMFDGLAGTIEVSRVFYGVFFGWSLRWQESGGAFNWNGKCWERCVGIEQVEQLALPLV